MAGISSKAAGSLENRNEKFQGQPLDDDLGLNWYGFKWRNHDPQIGRFIQIDPLSEEYVHNSTYAFSENKVVAHIELEGLEAVPYTHPMQPIMDGFGQGIQAIANWFDKTFSFGVKDKVTTTSTSSPNQSSSVEVKTETRTNFGEQISVIKNSDSPIDPKTLPSANKTTVTTTFTTENKSEAKIPLVGKATAKTSVDQNLNATSSADVSINTRTGFKVGVNGSINTQGDLKAGTTISAGGPSNSVRTSATTTFNGSVFKSLEMGAGFEHKKDNTTAIIRTWFFTIQ